MSRLGIYNGKKVMFTHRNPQTGEYWSDEISPYPRSPLGMWVDSKHINFDVKQPEKAKRKGR